MRVVFSTATTAAIAIFRFMRLMAPGQRRRLPVGLGAAPPVRWRKSRPNRRRRKRTARVRASRNAASRISCGGRATVGAARRVAAKAEWTHGKANPRFVVTSIATHRVRARHLYARLYCQRGEMENRIEERQLDLFADRTSTRAMRTNRLRLRFASMAYVLLCALRRIGGRHMREPAPETAQDRRLGPRRGAPRQDRHERRASLPARVPYRLRALIRRHGVTRPPLALPLDNAGTARNATCRQTADRPNAPPKTPTKAPNHENTHAHANQSRTNRTATTRMRNAG